MFIRWKGKYLTMLGTRTPYWTIRMDIDFSSGALSWRPELFQGLMLHVPHPGEGLLERKGQPMKGMMPLEGSVMNFFLFPCQKWTTRFIYDRKREKKNKTKEWMLWNCEDSGEDSWESLEQQDQTSQSLRKSILNIHWKDWSWSWNSNTLATWCKEPTLLKRPWCWETLKAKGEGGSRGWDGYIVSPTQWTWIWANSGR